jgi:hypothetical protein
MTGPAEQPFLLPLLDWGVAGVALPGQAESGDRHLIAEVPRGVLVAVADGLGHGTEARAAADAAMSTLACCPGEPIAALVAHCPDRLAGTRGVALSLAFFPRRGATFDWLGVGNVDGVHLPAGARPRHLPTGAGVVGYRLPPLRGVSVAVGIGDLLLLATDGIDPRFAHRRAAGPTAQAIADAILADYRKGTDDALVVAVRWRGGGIDVRA